MEVDAVFIQATKHCPKLAVVEADDIPLIDLSVLKSHNSSEPDATAIRLLIYEIGEACKNWGFFQVINHGVPFKRRKNLEIVARKFFAMSKEEKKKVSRDDVIPFLGYYDTEHTKNVRDWKEVFDLTVENPTLFPVSHEPDDKELREYINQWPKNPPELREECEHYAEEVQKLAYKLLELISMSLGLPANHLNGFYNDHTSFIRLNHYPPCPVPHLALGVGGHKDAGALTILAQDDVGGFEVKRKTDGEWIRVKPTHDAYIINVGDIIQVWSNDRYESVEHRATLNSKKDRISIPFFFNPAHYTIVEPLEELIDDQNLAKYKPYNWGKFFATRKRCNFQKLEVENIQISHFRRRQWKAVKAVCSSSLVQTTHKHNQQLLNLALELSSPDAQAFDFSFNTGGEKSTVKPQAPIKLEAFILFLLDHRERAKHDYEQLKKTVDELQAFEQNVKLVKELKL
ncbi:unnamed protein product [Ilex paraguariensis]|uniref:Fe2OG dioxygenase domain-containing protein n=1 Tax=Ilex paraguariensis TaxID=185542 RepID=A0ABC8UFD5_9AQUA